MWALARLSSVGVVFWGGVPRAEAQATGEVVWWRFGSVGFSPLGFCWALCFGVGVSRAEAQATGEVGYGCGRLRLVVVGAFFEV